MLAKCIHNLDSQCGYKIFVDVKYNDFHDNYWFVIPQVLPLKNEMKKPKNFDRPLGVLNVGMIIVSGMFVAIGFLAYLKYGQAVEGSVTLNLPKKEL